MPETSFADILKRPFRWPALGDKLWKEANASQGGGQLCHRSRDRLAHMAVGYKEGADILTEEFKRDHKHQTTLIYPTIFLYRHYIELQLKYILLTYGPDAGIPANWRTHNLATLWRDVRITIEYLRSDPDKEEIQTLDAVAALMAEFAKIDEKSFAFCYPVNPQGKLIDIQVDHIDLDHLRNVMRAMHHFFTGLDGQLDSLSSASP